MDEILLLISLCHLDMMDDAGDCFKHPHPTRLRRATFSRKREKDSAQKPSPLRLLLRLAAENADDLYMGRKAELVDGIDAFELIAALA